MTSASSDVRAQLAAAGWGERLRGLLPIALIVVAAPVVLLGTRYHVGLDGVAYLSIAQQYASGDVAGAINGYWSPLLPWLAAVPIAVGIPPIVAGHLAVLVGALLVTLGVRRIATALGAGARGADLSALIAAVFGVVTVTYGVFADLLVAGLIANAVAVLLSPRLRVDRFAGVELGLWSALAFLAKTYALPFLVVATAVAVGWHLRAGGPRRHVLTTAGTGLAVLAVVVGAWSAVLTAHYGEPTISTSAGYNIEIVSPGSEGNPIRYAGLLEPPSASAISAWDEPSLTPLQADGWSVSADAGRRLFDNVGRNLGEAADVLVGELPWLLLVGGATVLAWRRRPSARGPLTVLVTLAAIYVGGYVLTWVEARYLWAGAVLLLPAVALVVDDDPSAHRRPAAVALTALLAAAVVVPVADDVAARWGSGEETRAVARRLDELAGAEVSSANRWQRSAIVCLHVGCRYHGIPVEDGATLDAALADRGIRYHLSWQPAGTDAPLPADAERVGVFGDLWLYRTAGDG